MHARRITVCNPRQRPRRFFNLSPPILYTVRSILSAGVDGHDGDEQSVERRYRDFLFLRETLSQRYKGVLVPPLPEKRAIGNKRDTFVRRRMRALCMFLERLALNPFLRDDPCKPPLSSHLRTNHQE